MTQTVVLLHGLARTRRSMTAIERVLRHDEYDVRNIGYSSTSDNIHSLAVSVAERIPVNENDRLHFVTHSMGGIILRTMVARGLIANEQIGRVVMLGPPNGGSELADVLPRMPGIGTLYRRVLGPAGLALGTGPTGIAANLPPVSFELGVIAGNKTWNPIFAKLLGAESDGRVRVARTKVGGMRDFIVLPEHHPVMMRSPRVLRQTLEFLRNGRFDHVNT